MSDCSKHKKTVEKYPGDLKSLAEDIGNLHYEYLTEFLTHLSWKLNSDADKDYNAGRTKLSWELGDASALLTKTSKSINRAWKISEPYMKGK